MVVLGRGAVSYERGTPVGGVGVSVQGGGWRLQGVGVRCEDHSERVRDLWNGAGRFQTCGSGGLGDWGLGV